IISSRWPRLCWSADGVVSVRGQRYIPEHLFDRVSPGQRARERTMDLTKRQQEIFDFIKRYSARYGYPPTVRDIGKAVGLASSSTVHAHLSNLERIGMLRRDPSKPRAIELLDRAAAGVRNLVKPGLPLVGHVAAGQPVLAEENIEDYVPTPSYAGGDDGAYPLRVRGDSMEKVGILDGDVVVVKAQEVGEEGRVVVALGGGAAAGEGVV